MTSPHDPGVRLSYGQQRLWFLDRLTPRSAGYNNFIVRRLRGPLDRVAIERGLGEVVRRHQSLRTTFGSADGVPVARLVEPFEVAVHEVDLTGLGGTRAEAEARRLTREEVGTPFDLARAPLLRVTLLRLAEHDHVLVVTTHHIVADGWSLGLLFDELGALYRAHVSGEPAELPELAAEFSDYVDWQHEQLDEETLGAKLAYWRDQLDGVPTLELPAGRARPRIQTHDGANHLFDLPPGVSRGIAELARRERVTPYMAYVAAFAALLVRYSGQDDLAIGSNVAGRLRPEHERMIGFFTNTLVLRVDASGDPSFRDLLVRVRRTVFDAFAHQDVPFERIVSDLNVRRDTSRNPLFQVMFGLLNTPRPRLGLPGVEEDEFEFDPGITRFDLEFHLFGAGEDLRAEVVYGADLLAPALVERMARHFVTLLEGIASEPERRVSELPLLSDAERAALVAAPEVRAAAGEPPAATVHALVEASARARPEACAVACHGATLTYGELSARANRLAHHLRSLGVGRDTAVAICAERSPEMVVAVLAVLKAGGCYVPLDPSYPAERLRFMAEETAAPVLLTTERLLDRLPPLRASIVCLDRDAAELAHLPGGDPAPVAGADDLAYVIYTSGSTGRPKGVMMPHRTLVNLLNWQSRAPRLGEPAVTLQLASLSFDVGFQEIFSTFASGGSLVLAPEGSGRDPDLLWRVIRDEGVERLFVTPTALELLAHDPPADLSGVRLRDVVASGELLRVTPRVRALVDRTGCVLHNQYGPTETHVVTFTRDFGDGPAPLGRPIPNAELHVLDEHLNPVPPGVRGELFIGGTGARGYVAQPALTAERFIPDRLSRRPGARLYRSGDVVRLREDGQLEFLGRSDDQVKIRGHRIELGEVEARLAEHPDVGQAAVVAREDERGERRLVAYVTGAGTEPTASALRSFLADRLPEHMLPAAYVVVHELPLTPTRKVDRNALPDPPRERPALDRRYAAPATPTEELLAAVWSDVLELERVGVEDDFFELGGDSLRATRVAARGDALGIELPVRTVFEHPTIRRLGRWIDGNGRPAAAPAPAAGTSTRALSATERRFLFAAQLDEAAPPITGFSLRLRGPLDLGALERAFAGLVERHESLRSAFEVVAGEPRCRVADSAPVPFEVVEAAGDFAAAAARAREAFTQPFDLTVAPLLRVRVLRVAHDDHVVACPIHHIATDGWSNALLLDDLAKLYGAFRDGEEAPLGRAPGYGGFVAWEEEFLAGPEAASQRRYWRAQLAELEPLELPLDRPRRARPSFAAKVVEFPLDESLCAAVAELARSAAATPFMVYAAALTDLLRRVAGQDDVAIATVVGGRPRAEFEQVVGPFVNTVVLRTSVPREPTFRDLLETTRQVVFDAFANQDLPFDEVVADLGAEREPARNPIAQVMLSLENQPRSGLAFGGLTAEPQDPGTSGTVFDLVLRIGEDAGGLAYRTELFDDAAARSLQRRFVRLLRASLAAPDTPLSSLELADEEERRLLSEVNATAREVMPEPTLHRLVEAQVARTPEAVAVAFEGAELTYAELDARAAGLARVLRAAGAREERTVAVHLERSLELPVALLAVLKAGAACVPIDISYPPGRVDAMLRAVDPVAVVTADADRPWPAPAIAPGAGAAGDGVNGGAGADHLAFVIFTSGSTGAPKGVALPHAGLANRIACGSEHDGLGVGDRMLHKASISFDVALDEIFTPLVSGATVELASPGRQADPAYLVDIVRRRELTCIHFVPSLLHHVVNEPGLDACRTLRRVVCGGEHLAPALAAALLERLPHVEVVNRYGPTEASISVAFHRVVRADLERARVPIGSAIANTQLHVLDPTLSPLPPGCVGELYVGGVAVARGYLDPAATATSFVPDPFGPPGARLYRTGDRARRLPDGTLDVLGRVDEQVKVRGNRVEPGEVEAALRSQEGVNDAAVAVDGDTLVALVVPGSPVPSPDELAAHLRRRLPPFMVPTRIALAPELPRTASGKIDRREVSGVAGAQQGTRTARGTATGDAGALLAIWRDALEHDDLGPDDNFFQVGGHSLLVLRVVAEARERGLPLTARLMLEHQTVNAVLGALDAEGEDTRFVRLGDGRGRPAVVFHPGGGGVACYAQLAAAAKRSLLGVEAPETLPSTLAELAREYAGEIAAALAPPHMLVGWSLGASIAFEVARALVADGRGVDRLVLLEPPVLDGSGGAGDEGEDGEHPALRRLRELRRQAEEGGDPGPYRRALAEAGIGDPGEGWRTFPLDTWRALDSAASRHRYGSYAGAVDLVVSDACVDRDTDYYREHSFGGSYSDYRAHWRGVAGSVAMHQVGGDHFSLLGSNAHEVARVLDAAVPARV